MTARKTRHRNQWDGMVDLFMGQYLGEEGDFWPMKDIAERFNIYTYQVENLIRRRMRAAGKKKCAR